MKILSQEAAMNLVAEIAHPVHLATNALDVYKGQHPTEGRISIIVSILGDAVVVKLDSED